MARKVSSIGAKVRTIAIAGLASLIVGSGCGGLSGNDVGIRLQRLPGEVERAGELAAAPGVVRTDRGPVRGLRAGETYAYKGIPYAAPPVGPLRWRPPVGHPPWTEARDASQFGTSCPQITPDGSVVGKEDCLTLNVWAPVQAERAQAAGLPVMVWGHGGGNHAGMSAGMNLFGVQIPFDGQAYVEKHGVVLVTVNHRIGALGYLAHPALGAENSRGSSGNYGILDQIAALTWIQRNIQRFGGDPKRVTLFGNSSAALNGCVHIASPLSRGLFSGAILQSPIEGCNLRTLAQFERTTGASVANAAGCGATPDVAACLRDLSATAIVSAVPGKLDVRPRIYSPVVDGYVVTDSPVDVIRRGKHNRVPFIVGSSSDETSRQAASVGPIPDEGAYRNAVSDLFGSTAEAKILAEYPASSYGTPQKAFIAATTDALHICPSRRVARAGDAGQTEPVYRYFFTHALENSPLNASGAFHALDTLFVFGLGSYRPSASAAEIALADAMMGYWTRFAVSGNPNGGGAVPWPLYEAATDPYLQFDNAIVAGSGIRKGKCDFWDSLR